MRNKRAKQPESKIISGVAFNPNVSDLSCLLWLFLYSPILQHQPLWRPEEAAALALHPDDKDQPYTGSGRFEHAKLFSEIVWPRLFEWHDWSERDVRAFCEKNQIAISGGGGTGKSADAAFYSILYYACCPYETTVAIVSTTVEQAKKRIWKMVFALYPMIRRLFKCSVMHMSPTPRIQTVLPDGAKDPAHGVYVIPVAKGELERGIESLKGIHSRRVLLVGDETDSENMDAVVEVQDNLRSGTNEFQAIWLGNDPSLFNPLGQIMQPTLGGPVTIANVEWDSVSDVHCIRKDGFDSPNIRDKDKWTGLMRQRDIDEIVKRNGGVNTPGVFVMVRGLHPPEGVENTILSESLCLRYHVSAGVTWQRSFISSVLLDPAFGGDRCVIRLMMRGIEAVARVSGDMLPIQGAMRVLFGPPEMIPINATDTLNPPEYQIAHAAKTFAEKHGVGPDEFILDITGTGRGVGAVLQREWSPRINLCEFGGKCSDMPISAEDRRPANEMYDRKVTELWYSFRQFVEADMIRGLDMRTQREFCGRHFEIKGTGQGKRHAVEKKEDMKTRGLQSPDLADCCVTGIELLRRKGVHGTIKTEVKQQQDDRLEQAAREYDFEEAYSD